MIFRAPGTCFRHRGWKRRDMTGRVSGYHTADLPLSSWQLRPALKIVALNVDARANLAPRYDQIYAATKITEASHIWWPPAVASCLDTDSEIIGRYG